jgi:phosphate ABC transporter phosphate-binding protein
VRPIRLTSIRARRHLAALGAALVVVASVIGLWVTPARADSYVPVSGAGSTWSANAISAWVADVKQYGMRINYAATGSTDGRHQFLQNTVDFAASDIPFQSHPEDGSAPELPAQGSYAYIPVTAGGTTFMYNLIINGQRVTNLRLSGQNIAKIFTGQIVNWSDPAIKADNPQLPLPNRPIIPVVRSDGSGSTAQFSLWMINQYPAIWNAYCRRSGRAPSCGETSFYPTVPGMIAQNGDLGVAGYVSQGFANGAIGYVEYSYALNARFPVAKMLNGAGYYTEPTPKNVAVSLLQAQIDTTDTDPSLYLTQKLDNVYTDRDPRTYPLSSYSYMIIPTKVQGSFSTAKGKTLAAFTYFAMCQGQQEMGSIGYSPMPVNLVEDSFKQITKIPGAVVQSINVQSCNNPTFTPTGANLLAQEDPLPPACDKQGAVQCNTGTAGDPTPSNFGVAPGGQSGGSGGSGVSGGSGGSGGSSNSGGANGSAGTSAANGGTGIAGSRVATALGSRVRGSAAAGLAGTSGSGGAGASSSTVQCNPDTGQCSSSGSSGGALADASPNAVTIGAHGSTLYILVGLGCFLVLAIILLPGLLSRYVKVEKK